MAKWGDTTFKIQWGSYIPPHTNDSVTVIDILANHDDLTEPAQVLQQSGRKLRQVRFTVVEAPVDMTFYNALQADKDAGTVRAFEGPDGLEMDCIVQTINLIDHFKVALFFNVTLLEATDI